MARGRGWCQAPALLRGFCCRAAEPLGHELVPGDQHLQVRCAKAPRLPDASLGIAALMLGSKWPLKLGNLMVGVYLCSGEGSAPTPAPCPPAVPCPELRRLCQAPEQRAAAHGKKSVVSEYSHLRGNGPVSNLDLKELNNSKTLLAFIRKQNQQNTRKACGLSSNFG